MSVTYHSPDLEDPVCVIHWQGKMKTAPFYFDYPIRVDCAAMFPSGLLRAQDFTPHYDEMAYGLGNKLALF